MALKGRLPVLDGVRGFAALSVLLAHAAILSGWTTSQDGLFADLAVDVFMVMSGMLMSYHYHVRQDAEPWEQPRTWMTFYLRRFFRIAPLYYTLLFAAFATSAWMGHSRIVIGAAYPTSGTDAARYLPVSIANILWHVSFLFGFHPRFAFSTPLPDWSIGLEMQFYLFFPFIMLLYRRVGFVAASLILCGIRAVAHHFLLNAFPMPSFLPLKLEYFVVGILLSMYLLHQDEKPRTAALCAAMAAGIALVSQHARPVVFFVSLMLIYLLHQATLPASRRQRLSLWGEAVFGGAIAAWLADMSYGVYLVHLLIMLPLGAQLVHYPAYLALHAPLRCAVLFITTAVPAYLTALVLHVQVELRGILWGKNLVRRFAPRPAHSEPVPANVGRA